MCITGYAKPLRPKWYCFEVALLLRPLKKFWLIWLINNNCNTTQIYTPWKHCWKHPLFAPITCKSPLKFRSYLVYELIYRNADARSTKRTVSGCFATLRQMRLIRKIAVLPFKVQHGMAPEYLGTVVRVADLPGRQSLRSVGTNRLVVPPRLHCQHLALELSRWPPSSRLE